MELSDNRDESAGAAKLLHYLPQALSADRIEGLGHINQGYEEVAVLLLAFFLELTCCKYHVDSFTPYTEATLTLWEETVLKLLQKAIDKDASQDLSSYGQEAHASWLFQDWWLPFLLNMWTMLASFNCCSTFPSFHMDWKSLVSFSNMTGPPALYTSTGIASDPGALPQESCLIAS